MAAKVGAPALYEFLYRYWSNEVHAGSAMEAIGQKDGETVIRPIRHPGDLQQAVNLAGTFSVSLARKIVEAYAPGRMAGLRTTYLDKIHQKASELRQKQIINAPWRDAAI